MSVETTKVKNLVFVVNTQQEFWHREYQGVIYEKNESYQQVLIDLIAKGYCPVFQVDDDPSEFQFLATLPKESLVAWCHSDERFDLDFNRRISETSAIKLVLRPYRLNRFSLKKLFRALIQTFVNLRYSKSITFALKLFLWQGRGISMQYRQLRIRRLYSKNQKKYLDILIGYTNVFASSFLSSKEFSQSTPDMSLFDLISPQELKFGDRAVTFSGQTGQVVRETALIALSKFPESFLLCRDSYGASNVIDGDVRTRGLEYVEILRQSRLVLCPPGNISGESFRIFETILMRRIPVAMGSVTSDPNYELPFKFLGEWNSRFSWGGVIKGALKSDSLVLRNLAQSNFDYYKEEISRTRLLLETTASN